MATRSEALLKIVCALAKPLGGLFARPEVLTYLV